MPKTSFSEVDLKVFVNSILMEGGRSKIERLLERCHEFKSPLDPAGLWLQPHEKFFRKEIVYDGFDLHIKNLLCDGDSVVSADIQFKRPSRFPSPLFNRNRELVAKLLKLLDQFYSTKSKTYFGIVYAISRDQVKDENGRQIHFDAPVRCSPSTSFEEWESECALYDEPFSSGATNPTETETRNDFVLIRFRRK